MKKLFLRSRRVLAALPFVCRAPVLDFSCASSRASFWTWSTFCSLLLSASTPQVAFASGCAGPEYELEYTRVISTFTVGNIGDIYIERHAGSGHEDLGIVSLYTEAMPVKTNSAHSHYYWHKLSTAKSISADVSPEELYAGLNDQQALSEIVEDTYVDSPCSYPDYKVKNLRITVPIRGDTIEFRTDYFLPYTGPRL